MDNKTTEATHPESGLLGPGLFGTADGADALRIVFMTGHAQGIKYGGLLRTCRAGRDWVLTTAPHVSLQLQRPNNPSHTHAWDTQLKTVKQALITRGKQSTALAVHFAVWECVLWDQLSLHDIAETKTDTTTAVTTADSLVSLILEYGECITELALLSDYYNQSPHIATLLQRAAPGLSSLTTLDLSECACVLPPPSQLPSLKHLSVTVRKGDASFHDSVAAILPQLTALCYRVHSRAWDVAAMLRNSPGPLLGLDQLVVTELSDALVGAVLDLCPNLARIETKRLCVWSEQHRDREWRVRELVVGKSFFSGEVGAPDEHMQALEVLALLPRPVEVAGPEGAKRERVRITCPATHCSWADASWKLLRYLDSFEDFEVKFAEQKLPVKRLFLYIDDKKGLPEHVAERLKHWCFDLTHKEIHLHHSLLRYAQRDALRATLKQLIACKAPGAVVTVRYRYSAWEVYNMIQEINQLCAKVGHLRWQAYPYGIPSDDDEDHHVDPDYEWDAGLYDDEYIGVDYHL